MSSRKANTVFHVKLRRTRFITLAYVPEALHNPKLILTHSKSPNFVVNAVFLKTLLSEYSDVFAQDDLDLGNFTELEHAIDTGTAKPVKLRMRRMSRYFGRKHLVLKA
jgi:hypothetical protein